MNVNCTNCGAMLVGGEKVCPVCRQPVAPTQGESGWQQLGAPSSLPWQQPVGQPHQGPPPGVSSNTGLKAVMLILIGLALMVVLAAAGIIVYVKNRDAAIRANNEAIDEPVGNDPSLVAPDENSSQPPSAPTPRTSNSSRAPISGGVLNGKAISLPKPPYPAIARAARASGTVVVQVTVDESGNVTEARAVSGHPLLQASAVQAARQARFSPTMLAGKPVKVTGTLSYKFELE